MEGRHVPSIVFKIRVRDESIGGPNPFRWEDVSSDELFRGRRVVVFSLPGAFTPTCSNKQCPSFEALYPQIRKHGIEEPGINDEGRDDDPYTVTNPDILLDYLKSHRSSRAAE